MYKLGFSFLALCCITTTINAMANEWQGMKIDDAHILQDYIAFDNDREQLIIPKKVNKIVPVTPVTNTNSNPYAADPQQSSNNLKGYNTAPQKELFETNTLDNTTNNNLLRGNSELYQLLNQNNDLIISQGVVNKIHNMEAVRLFYNTFDNELLWTQDGKVTALAYQLIQEILKAGEHALLPEIYHSNAVSVLQSGQKIYDHAQFDIVMSDAFITYKKHLTNGIMDPKKQFSTWNLKPREVNFPALYMQASQYGDLSSVFTIDDDDYLVLQSQYKEYLSRTDNANLRPLADKKLVIGNQGENIVILREKLGLPTDSDLFDEEVKTAVKTYQKSKGLGADGIVGRNTIRSLNKTLEKQLEKLAINMERHRWGYIPQYSNYIWVNIPAYEMAVKNKNDAIFESKVVVGRPKRPTPVFSDILEHVVLSPYWNVPKTIFREDKLPRLKKNPGSFGNSMQVINTSTGKVVNASSVNWSNGGKGYRLRQLPGRRNALGRMKFLFPNKHAIYLHDTPNKKLFKRQKRAYSSGCVRVEKAADLANFLLADMGWSPARVKKESYRKREKWVNLDDALRYPVFLNYLTTWVDSDKKIRQSRDIYGYDKKMKKLYQQTLTSYL